MAADLTRVPAGAIRFHLVLPVTKFSLGPFSVDPLASLLGMPVVELLASLLTAQPVQRRTATGTLTEVYPLCLPAGEGASFRLGSWGDVGFFNADGLLKLTVPWSTADWIRSRLGSSLVRGPEHGLGVDGASPVAHLWLRLTPGMRASLPLASFGELGLEAG